MLSASQAPGIIYLTKGYLHHNDSADEALRGLERRYMTVCVAMECDDRESIVLVGDKMVGIGFIEAEPDISKILVLHKDWYGMVAGNDISPVFDIVDKVQSRLAAQRSLTVSVVARAVEAAFQEKRREAAEARYLAPRTLTLAEFYKNGAQHLSPRLYHELDGAIERHQLDLSLLIAGFEKNQQARIFSIKSPGISSRHEIPGFHAIGSGAFGALYMLYYRSASARFKLRRAVYAALEAKYFAEQATGVGPRTDVFVLKPGRAPIELREDETVEKVLFKICSQVSPRQLTRKHVRMLNQIPELRRFARIDYKEKFR